MKKNQVIEKIETAFQAFSSAFSDFSDIELEQPGVNADWSIKDLIAHVSTWEEEAIKYLPVIIIGQRPPRYKDAYGGLDKFNQLMTEQKRALTLREVLRLHSETHAALITFLNTIPEKFFTTETPFRRRLRLDTWSHYPLHTKAINAWRRKLNQ